MEGINCMNKLWLFTPLALIVGTAAVVAATSRPAPVVLKPKDISWTTRPTGVRVAVLAGDPKKAGPFVLRLEYPAGYVKAPHHHPGDAYVTVLSGSYYRGYGHRFDKSKAVTLTQGTFSINPAGVSHYEWTTEPASLEVHAVGPWSTQYVDDEGRPTRKPQATR